MTVLLVLVIFLIIILAFLCVPVIVRGQLSRHDMLEGTVNVLWGSLAGVRIRFIDRKATFHLVLGPWSRPLEQRPRERSAEKRLKPKNQTKSSKKPGWGQFRSMLTKAVWQELTNYIKRLFRSLKFRGYFNGEYGFDDPSLTGMLCGSLAALNIDDILCLEPNFAESVIIFDSEFSCRIIPTQIMWITGGFAFSRAIRAIWWPQIFKWKRKRRFNLNVQGEC